MVKRIAVILLSVVIIASLAGCNNGAKSHAPASEKQYVYDQEYLADKNAVMQDIRKRYVEVTGYEPYLETTVVDNDGRYFIDISAAEDAGVIGVYEVQPQSGQIFNGSKPWDAVDISTMAIRDEVIEAIVTWNEQQGENSDTILANQGPDADKNVSLICVNDVDIGLGSGYTGHLTFEMYPDWVRTSDKDLADVAWKAVGGTATVDKLYSTAGLGGSVVTGVDNCAVAFGRITIKNTTEGFSFSEESPSALLTLPIRFQGSNSMLVGTTVLGFSSLSAKMTILDYYGAICPFYTMLKSDNSSIAVAFFVKNVFSPNFPDGNPALSEATISMVRDGDSYSPVFPS